MVPGTVVWPIGAAVILSTEPQPYSKQVTGTRVKRETLERPLAEVPVEKGGKKRQSE